VNDYVAAYPKVPFDGVLGDVFLRPTASYRSIVEYPAFMIAGVLALALIAFLIRPALGDAAQSQYLMLAAFFATVCQSNLLLISLINVSTPRFLMAVYPRLVVALIFMLLALRRHRTRDPTIETV
jgi:hypothetical protein